MVNESTLGYLQEKYLEIEQRARDTVEEVARINDCISRTSFEIRCLQEEIEEYQCELERQIDLGADLNKQLAALGRDIAMLKSGGSPQLSLPGIPGKKLNSDELKTAILSLLKGRDWMSTPDLATALGGLSSYDTIQKMLYTMHHTDKSLDRDTSKRYYRYKIKDGWTFQV
jgi:hypothetical protein